MKKHFSVVSVLLLAAVALQAQIKPLEIGAQAPLMEQKMMDVSGKEYSLNDIMMDNGMLVIFSCNTCPFVKAWEGRLNEIHEVAQQNKVGYVLINSNERNRKGVDSFEKMKEHAKENAYKMPYVVDEMSKVANAFGGQTTPHAFLFNKDGKLVYRGTIDDNYKDASAVEKAYIKEAIVSMVAGKAIAIAETNPQGCSIKRPAGKL